MSLEKLNDKSLFRILKVIYNDVDELGDLYDNYSSNIADVIKNILKHLGLDTNFLNIQYIYICLDKNWNSLESESINRPLIRPKLKIFDVNLDVDVIKNCTEVFKHKIKTYDTKESLDSYIDMLESNGDFYISDGEYIEDECEHYDITGWKISDINEIKP